PCGGDAEGRPVPHASGRGQLPPLGPDTALDSLGVGRGPCCQYMGGVRARKA
ncbi:hypothetical protein BaRGS_00013263, partial [Batillaria attramentaria]